MEDGDIVGICINDALTDDELRAILGKLETDKEKEVFGLVCKRWPPGSLAFLIGPLSSWRHRFRSLCYCQWLYLFANSQSPELQRCN
ncbi:hypothetical protein RJ641_003560 [Dillenia turbinata]|uniref:Uncharacterized protein n=1 Tax=Dillenia turbinata TaxID=194707 RepID=A0AAN8VQV8_9MAGN